MKIFVLIKRTIDTEGKIVIKNGNIMEDHVSYIVNPYDEYAIEEAVRLKEDYAGEVIVVSVGGEGTDQPLRTALAMGADKAVWIDTESDSGDAFTTAHTLAEFFEEEEADMIFAGHVAIDEGSGEVGPRLAERLGIPAITSVTSLEIKGSNAILQRDVEGDKEMLETSFPFLMTTQQGLNEPRYPSLSEIMKAKKKPLEKRSGTDFEKVKPKTETVEVYLPSSKKRGKRLEGDVHKQVGELGSFLQREARIFQ